MHQMIGIKFLGVRAAGSRRMDVLHGHLQRIAPTLIITADQKCLVWQALKTLT